MSMTLLASALVAATVTSQGVDYIGRDTTRDRLIINAAPYRTNVVDAGRAQSGRLWISTAERRDGAQGMGRYGAGEADRNTVIYVRVDKTPVAISPWTRLDKQGLARHERARNVWLKEQGYTHAVRTHVNESYMRLPSVESVEAIKPSAVIHVRERGGPVCSAE